MSATGFWSDPTATTIRSSRHRWVSLRATANGRAEVCVPLYLWLGSLGLSDRRPFIAKTTCFFSSCCRLRGTLGERFCQ